MSPRVRTSPRKQPLQERSRATVDAIVGATIRVLIRDGYDGCSTNKVASEAGVSVGSLYQYFPSKESLVLAVMERHSQELTERIEARLAELVAENAPLDELTRALVHEMLEMHQLQPKLHRVLIEQVPRIGALGRLAEMNRRFEAIIAAFIEAQPERFEIKGSSLAAFVLVTAIESLTHHAVLYRPELLSSGKLEDHLVRLALAYVSPSLVVSAQREGRALGHTRKGHELRH